MHLLLFIILSGLAVAQEVTPTRRVTAFPSFVDDLAFENLELAIDRQLASYDRRGTLRGTIRLGQDTYPREALRESLISLRLIAARHRECLKERAENCQQKLDRAIRDNFAVYAPASGPTKYTSYYSPDLKGSRVPSAEFRHPIYQLPRADLARAFTRVEIDHDGKLSGLGLELFWVSDSLFDIYLLHVQGGGRVTLVDPSGSTEKKYLSMTGHNGKKCEFIGHHIARLGWLPKPEALRIPAQRKFLEENPEKTREAFRHCQNYIYFRESDDEPVGRDVIPLTVNRSVALDHTLYKTTGLISFVKTKKLGQEFSRFFLAQDTGSKIKGAARADLYMGYGPEAEAIAYSMNTPGEQYFLILRNRRLGSGQ